MLDPNSAGSHLEMYWWDVIHGMYSEWEADKHRGGGDKKGDGPVKRSKGGARKKPVKQSQRGKKA